MKTAGKVFLGIFIVIAVVALSFVMKTCSISEKHVTNSMENAVISYDEYQDIYATCVQLNADLGVIKDTPENDAQFAQFSKQQRINTLKQQLNRWINEYNSKSQHIDNRWWKSKELPYRLSSDLFSNY